MRLHNYNKLYSIQLQLDIQLLGNGDISKASCCWLTNTLSFLSARLYKLSSLANLKNKLPRLKENKK